MNYQLNTDESNKAETLVLSSTMTMIAKNRALKPIATAVLVLMTTGLSTQLLAQTTTENKVDSLGITSPVASVCGTAGVVFKNPDGSNLDILNSNNSRLPVAADLGLWGESKGLPLGSKILLTVSDAKAPADGRSFLKIGVKAYDAAGALITSPVKLLIETSLGRLSVDGYSTQVSTLEVATKTGEACLNLVASNVAGESLVRVSSGAVKVQGIVDFVPDLRPMLVVGMVEGAISLTKFKKDTLTPNIATTDFDETLRNFAKTTDDGDKRQTVAGRVAMFVKGTVKGEYLLTAAYDSDKIVQQKLFRDIDPNTYYPIYGDASVKNFDAQSASRLYVRVDKDKSYMLYGDFTTASTDEASKLASYSRSLTGVKYRFENETVKVNAWAARDTLRAYVDEQPGLGISGPYAVAQPNAIANSEKVELLVRDRVQVSVILKRELLTRFVDYDFEPFTGKILFRKPISSVDENLNPVSIRITYEVDEGGEKFWVGGVDAKIKAGPVSIGASHVEDKNSLAPYKLSGVNAEIKLGEKTYFVAEVAKSTGTQFYNQSIDAITSATSGSPTTLGGSVPSANVQSGQAARMELRHSTDELQARAYVSRADTDFQNSNAGLTAGREEAGANISYKANEQLVVKVDLILTKELVTLSKREAISSSVSYKISDALSVEVGVNHVKEKGKSGALSLNAAQNSQSNYGISTSNGASLLPSLSTTTAATTSSALIDNEYTSLRARLTAKVTEDASIYGEIERAADDTGRQRAAFGAEYRINEKSRVYGRYEFENTLSGNVAGYSLSGTNTRTSVIGIDTEYMKDGQLFSEYRLSGAQNGFDAAASIGVRNQWSISDGLVINTSAERQALRPFEGAKGDAVAISLGALYSGNPVYKLGGKLEYRTSRPTDQWNATLAYDRKLTDNWSAIARNLFMYTHDKWDTGAGDQTQNRFQLGLAYRDVETNMFNGLARLEHRTDISTALADLKNSTTTVFSVQGNYHPVRAFTLNGQAAFKYVNETFGDVITKWQGTLLSGRVSYDFTDRIDGSIMASRMWGTGASVSGIGAEVGVRLVDNMWLGLSYNIGKFVDTELFSSNASWTGWHLRMNYKYH
ncbi:MAG: hypothetical protein RJB10_204 [Pseudomonadota bacterium]|jgi:hypothetical protein